MKPFNLICFECKTTYESYFNNERCHNCGGEKEKRWIFNREFSDKIKEPKICTIENFQKKLKFNLTFQL